MECPRCHAPNLQQELCCFACGARLRPGPKRFGAGPAPAAPWPLWVGIALVVAVAGLLGYQAVCWLVGYRDRVALPPWRLLAIGSAIAVAGQAVFFEARRRERRSWHLRRAPELPLSQCHSGDAVWARGQVKCDTPVVPAYFPQECTYYHYVVRERDPGESDWRVTERDTKVVDFELVDGDESVYVPSGCAHFDAPLYVECYLDPDGARQVKLWAIPVGLPVSLCGRVAGLSSRPRVDQLEEDLPGVVTWRTPQDYLAMLTKQAGMLHLGGWLLTAAGLLTLLAGLASQRV